MYLSIVCIMFWVVVDDLRAMLSKLDSRLSVLEKSPSQAPKAAAAPQVNKNGTYAHDVHVVHILQCVSNVYWNSSRPRKVLVSWNQK